MPIRNHIEAIVQSLDGAPGFIYGTANELNTLADSATFPCVFMYPLDGVELSPQVNGKVDNIFNLTIEFLFQTDFGEYTADNESYVANALAIASQFIQKAAAYRSGSRRYFKIKPGDKARCRPVYNKFNVNTTGVVLNIALAATNS